MTRHAPCEATELHGTQGEGFDITTIHELLNVKALMDLPKWNWDTIFRLLAPSEDAPDSPDDANSEFHIID